MAEMKDFCILCGHDRGRIIFLKNGYRLKRCGECGLVYVGNPPSIGQLRPLYSFAAGYFAEVQRSGRHILRYQREARRRAEIVRRYGAGGRLLDVGCAAGFFLAAGREHGWDCHGVDLSADLASFARERFGLKVVTGTLEDQEYPRDFFDVVTLWDVLEHTLDPGRTLSKIHRILRPDGLLFIITPNIDGLFPAVSYRLARILNYWPHPTPPAHTFQFSKKTLARFLQIAGFRIIATQDRRIRLAYSLNLEGRRWSAWRLLYALCFLPAAWLGPLVGAGDEVLMVAAKEPDGKAS